LDRLDSIIGEFPFVTPNDRSVALSAFLTVLDRCARPSPLFGIKAPLTRSGKSLLVNLAGILMDGCSVFALSQADNEELEKRINGALVDGRGLIAIDNINRELYSDLMSQTITEGRVSIRILGYTGQKDTPTSAVFFVNGNRLRLVKDLSSRTVLIEIDPKCERPELREFKQPDLKGHVLAHRAELVCSALTALRAFHVSGAQIKLPEWGGFETWTNRIRKPLVWLGRRDPWHTTAKARDDDPALEELRTVLAQWRMHLVTGEGYRVQDIIGRASRSLDFHLALLAAAASYGDGDQVNPKRLGRWLVSNADRVVDGVMLCKQRIKDGYPYWQVVEVN
jgi:hypothetical protein